MAHHNGVMYPTKHYQITSTVRSWDTSRCGIVSGNWCLIPTLAKTGFKNNVEGSTSIPMVMYARFTRLQYNRCQALSKRGKGISSDRQRYSRFGCRRSALSLRDSSAPTNMTMATAVACINNRSSSSSSSSSISIACRRCVYSSMMSRHSIRSHIATHVHNRSFICGSGFMLFLCAWCILRFIQLIKHYCKDTVMLWEYCRFSALNILYAAGSHPLLLERVGLNVTTIKSWAHLIFVC